MNKTIGRFPNFMAARQQYARRLLARDDRRSLDEAARQITKLREIAPGDFATFELTVRLASKLGKQKQVRNELLSRLPAMPAEKELQPGQAQHFAAFANLLLELGDLDWSRENLPRPRRSRSCHGVPTTRNSWANTATLNNALRSSMKSIVRRTFPKFWRSPWAWLAFAETRSATA